MSILKAVIASAIIFLSSSVFAGDAAQKGLDIIRKNGLYFGDAVQCRQNIETADRARGNIRKLININAGPGCFGSPYDGFIPGKKKIATFVKMVRDDARVASIGVGLVQYGNDVVLGAVPQDGPAYHAGIRLGDQIIKTEESSGKKCRNLDYNKQVAQVYACLFGPEGTELTVTVKRDGKKYEYSVVREAGPLPVVSFTTMMVNGRKFGYTRSLQITDSTGEQMVGAAFRNPNNIIDLRGNSGGDPSSMTKAMLPFAHSIDDVLYVVGKRDEKKPGSYDLVKTTYTVGDKLAQLYPDARAEDIVGTLNGPGRTTIILMDKKTISAPELYAEALKQLRRSGDNIIIIGEKSAGKSEAQRPFIVTEDLGVVLTVARYWVGENETLIHGEGVEPDIYVKNSTDSFVERGTEKDAPFMKAVSLMPLPDTQVASAAAPQ